ncbi:MAG: hypothetical protein RL133_595 [Pseudomonadota bacterium]
MNDLKDLKEQGEGLDSALDGLLSGIDQLLAQRPDGLTTPVPLSENSAGISCAESKPRSDPTLHVVTALLHQCQMNSSLREATIAVIRRLVMGRAVSPPETLAWRGDPQISPRLKPWFAHISGRSGLQAWTEEAGEWVYVAQSLSHISDATLRAHPNAWLDDIGGGFPVASLAEVSQTPQGADTDEPYQILRVPRFPEFCRLSLKNGQMSVDADGLPAMVRWLDRTELQSPSLLGLAWPLSESFDEHLRFPIPVVSVAANLR